MENLIDELKETVSEYEKIHVDGKFSRNRTIEQANKSDEKLIELLLSNDKLKNHFFTEAGDTYVFDKEKFVEFVNNKQFLEDSYTQFKNKVGLKTGDEYFREKKDVELAWPYKDCVLEGGQTKEDEDRKEKFWNKTLAPDQVDKLLDPKVLTNFKRYTEDGEKEVEEISEDDNLFIRGNNLLALHSLKKKYRGEVKLIYIDPPYNTNDDDFRYNDSFNESSWLTFMKNRLEIAKELLSEDGLIFINIDDNEQAYLSALCDEIFGEENTFDKISIETSSSQGGFGAVNPGLISNTENILIYSKNEEEYEFNEENMYAEKDYDSNYDRIIQNPEDNPEEWNYTKLDYMVYEEAGIEKPYNRQTWRKLKEKWGEAWKDLRRKRKAELALENRDRVFRTYNPNKPGDYLKEGLEKSKKQEDQIVVVENPDTGDKKLCLNGELIIFYEEICREIDGEIVPTSRLTTFWDDIAWEGISNEGGVKLRNGKKPEKLLKRIIEISTEEGELVLDFFLGSGTTAAVAHKMNRQYIGVEQLDYGDSDPTVRLDNVINGDSTGISVAVGWEGGGDFVYTELMELNSQFLEKIEDADSQEGIKKIWEEMKDEAFLSYKVDIKKVDENSSEFEDLNLEDQKEFLRETLDKNQLYVNLSEIDDSQYGVSEKVKELNEEFYE